MDSWLPTGAVPSTQRRAGRLRIGPGHARACWALPFLKEDMTQKLLNSTPLRVNRWVHRVCPKTELQQLAAGLKTSISGKPILVGTLIPQGYQHSMHPFLPAFQTEWSQELQAKTHHCAAASQKSWMFYNVLSHPFCLLKAKTIYSLVRAKGQCKNRANTLLCYLKRSFRKLFSTQAFLVFTVNR